MVWNSQLYTLCHADCYFTRKFDMILVVHYDVHFCVFRRIHENSVFSRSDSFFLSIKTGLFLFFPKESGSPPRRDTLRSECLASTSAPSTPSARRQSIRRHSCERTLQPPQQAAPHNSQRNNFIFRTCCRNDLPRNIYIKDHIGFRKLDEHTSIALIDDNNYIFGRIDGDNIVIN